MIKRAARNRKERRHPGFLVEDRGAQIFPINLGIKKFKYYNTDNKRIKEFKEKQWKEFDEQSKNVHISKQGAGDVNRKSSSPGSSRSRTVVGDDGAIEQLGGRAGSVTVEKEASEDSTSGKGRKSSKNS